MKEDKWKVVETTNDIDFSHEIVSETGGTIAAVYREKDSEAKSVLIAAARELLQMLIELNTAIDDYWNSDTKPDILVRHICMKQKQAKAAISKATKTTLP